MAIDKTIYRKRALKPVLSLFSPRIWNEGEETWTEGGTILNSYPAELNIDDTDFAGYGFEGFVEDLNSSQAITPEELRNLEREANRHFDNVVVELIEQGMSDRDCRLTTVFLGDDGKYHTPREFKQSPEAYGDLYATPEQLQQLQEVA